MVRCRQAPVQVGNIWELKASNFCRSLGVNPSGIDRVQFWSRVPSCWSCLSRGSNICTLVARCSSAAFSLFEGRAEPSAAVSWTCPRFLCKRIRRCCLRCLRTRSTQTTEYVTGVNARAGLAGNRDVFCTSWWSAERLEQTPIVAGALSGSRQETMKCSSTNVWHMYFMCHTFVLEDEIVRSSNAPAEEACVDLGDDCCAFVRTSTFTVSVDAVHGRNSLK